MSEKRLIRILKNNAKRGMSITELVEASNLSRSAVRIMLAKLEGAGIIFLRQAGMAKLYFLESNK